MVSILIFPSHSWALQLQEPDPLSKIHNKIFIDDKLIRSNYFEYEHKKNLNPKNIEGLISINPNEKTIFSVNNEQARLVLEINFEGESLYNHPNIIDPELTIRASSGEEISVKLNRPKFHIKGLSADIYQLIIDDKDLGYDYNFDLNLVDWQYFSVFLYASSGFDFSRYQEKIDIFTSNASFGDSKYIISSNPQLLSSFGLSFKNKKVSPEESLELEGLGPTITLFESGDDWHDLYPNSIGKIILAKNISKNGINTKIVALSPSLTTLSINDLDPFFEQMGDYLIRNNLINYTNWLIFILAIVMMCLIGLNWRKIKHVIITVFVGLKKKRLLFLAGLIIIFSLIMAGFLIKREIIPTSTAINFFGEDLSKMVNWLHPYFLPIFFVLFFLTVSFYFLEIKNWIFSFSKKNFKLLFIFLTILLFLLLLNLFTKKFMIADQYILFLILLITSSFLILRIFNGRFNSQVKISLTSGILIILIALLPILIIGKASMPVWRTYNWQKSFIFEIDKGRIKSSPELKIRTPKKNYKIDQNNLKSFTSLDYRLLPNLFFSKPDSVSFDFNIESMSPVFFETVYQGETDKFLIHYPDIDNYQSSHSWGDFIIHLKNNFKGKINDSVNIEDFINQLPVTDSIEICPSIIGKEGNLSKLTNNLIDLSELYRNDLVVDPGKTNLIKTNFLAENLNLYTFLDEKLELKISKRDLNQSLGKNELALFLYDSDNNLKEIFELSDDGAPLGKRGELIEYNFSVKNIEKGVYRIFLRDYTGNDSMIEEIEINSPYLVFDTSLASDTILSESYRKNHRSLFASFNREEYFEPLERELVKSGMGADILVYRNIDSFDVSQIRLNGVLNFIISSSKTTNDHFSHLKVNNFEIIYNYNENF